MTKLWKRNAVVALVLLFICVGIYLNWSYTQDAETVGTTELGDTLDTALLDTEEVMEVTDTLEATDTLGEEPLLQTATGDTTLEEYFAAIRLSRQESRDSAVELLQETMAYEAGEDTEAASAASAQLQEMVETALKEAEIEGLIMAKGYEDCVTYMSDGAISVAVAAPETGLEEQEVAKICDIVTTQSGYSPSELKIIEVK